MFPNINRWLAILWTQHNFSLATSAIFLSVSLQIIMNPLQISHESVMEVGFIPEEIVLANEARMQQMKVAVVNLVRI